MDRGQPVRVYRASSLGYSLEQLVAPHLGYEPVSPPDFLQAAYDEGNRIEPLAIEKLRARNWAIRTFQDEVNAVGNHQIEVELEIIPGEVAIVGHLDGIGLPVGGIEGVVEIKCMAAKSWEAFKRQGWDAPGLVQKYKFQASAYMHATHLPHYMVAWNKETKELHIVEQTEPFYPVEVLANKVLAAEQHIRDGVLPEGCTDFPCPYFYLHADKETVPVEEADEELDTLLDIWLSFDQNEKAAKKAKDRLREQIIARAGEDSVGKIKSSSGVTVTTSWVEAKEVSYTTKPHWETRITGPRR